MTAKLRTLLVAFVGWLATTAAAVAQTTPAPTPAPATSKVETIQLSPFEVVSETDNGYKANGTLAGTRLRTDLRDVAASITVVTKEFMNDIGATTLEGLLTYTVGTEVSGLSGNYSSAGSDANFTDSIATVRSPTGNNRVRGLGGADNTRDYFLSSLPMDGYNTDRVEINRGPNAMLFGLGSPSGIINTGLIRAMPNRTKTKVEGQYGQHDTGRIVFDHNQVLVKDRLALRIATLYGEKKYQIKPAYVRDERAFATATWRPWKTGTLRASSEHAKQFSSKAYNTPPTDQFSWWWALGKPVYNPTTGIGRYLGTPPTDPNIQPLTATFGINGNVISQASGRMTLVMENPNVTKFGLTGLDPAIMGLEMSNNRVRLNAAGTAYANDGMRWLNNAKNFLQRSTIAAQPALFNFWRDFKLTDPAIFDFYNESLEGINRREWAFWKTYNANFEQRLGAHAGVELAFDKQFLDSGYVQPNQFRNHAINIDINTHLPNGTPNPNLGRPFINTAEGFQSYSATDREAYRATGYYDLDLQRDRTGWLGKALGRHIFTGSFTSQNRVANGYGGRPHQLGVDYFVAESANETKLIPISDGQRVMSGHTYIGPSVLNASSPRNNGLQGVRAINTITPGTPITGLYYQAPPATPVALAPWQTRTFTTVPTEKYDLSRTATGPSRRRDEVDSLVFVANSYWWDHTLVSTLGWRQDSFQNFDAGTSLTDPTTGLRVQDPAIWKWTTPTIDDSARSFNYGLVLHTPPFLRGKLPLGADVSLTYNKSDNFSPAAQRFDMFGKKLAPPTGSTEEWGGLVSLFRNKIELRFTKYETRARLATAGVFTEIQNVIVRRLDSQIEANSGEIYREAAPRAALAAWNQWQAGPDAKNLFETFNFKFSPGPNGTTIVDRDDRIGTVVNTTDNLATGYEFDVIANPTPQWRIAFNAARQQTVSGNTGASFAKMIAVLNPVWGGTAAALPDSATSTSTLGQTWAGQVVNAQKAIALDGAPSPELRRWRYNVVSNYSFNQGRLKGWRFGGAYRWQDKAAIGYPVKIFPDGSGVYDVTKPFFGPTEANVDGWIGYSRKLNEKIRWSAQLNVRNIGVGDRLIPVSAQPDGTYDTMRIADPQTWLLTTSFEF